MNLDDARIIAEQLVDLLAPACKRIEIAGSIRRMKPEAHDIEILAIPDLRPAKLLFGQPAHKSVLDAVLYSLQDPDENGFCIHQLLGGDKYKKFAVSLDGGQTAITRLDLFLVTPPAQWGVDYVIRTGPAQFSKWMVTQRHLGGALPNNCKVEQACVWRDGKQREMPEEIDFFRYCGLEWIEPKNRIPRWRTGEPRRSIHNSPKPYPTTGF